MHRQRDLDTLQMKLDRGGLASAPKTVQVR